MLPFDEAERWLPVVGWEGFYEVSDLARVRSLPRRTRSGMRGGRILKQNPRRAGYMQVGLSREGEAANYDVHVLVAAAFLGPRPEGEEVCHKNPGKLDNRASALEWGTRAKNVGPDRLRDGQDNRGERSGVAKLTWESVADIRRRVAGGESQRSVARLYGISFQNVSMIVTGKTWIDAEGPVQALGGHGEGNAMAKLTWTVVDEIRRRAAGGEKQHVLAHDYGVGRANVGMIVQGRSWREDSRLKAD
jgi:hypothetical protein